jgi:hypothetical protein
MTPRGRLPGGLAAVGALSAGLVAMVAAARTAGTTPDEPGRHLPGDELLPDAAIVTTRATTISAPPAAVWPWLVQMGYQRGGWYAVDALERLIGAGDFLTGDSADRIVEELQNLAVGERVPLNDRMHLVVARFEPDRALVLALPDQPLEWIWSFVLEPIDDGSTRLLIRTRIGARDRWMVPLLPVLDAGHMTMELVQLRNLRERAEALHASTAPR